MKGIIIKRVVTLCIQLLCMSACVYIPLPEGDALSGSPFTEESISRIKIGKTSKKDIIQEYGQPDIVYDESNKILIEQNIFIYRWEHTVGVLVFGSAALNKNCYAYAIAFDDVDIVRKHELLKIGKCVDAYNEIHVWRINSVPVSQVAN